MFGLKSEDNVKKLILRPIAKGINPKIVVIAVNKTGLKRALQLLLLH